MDLSNLKPAEGSRQSDNFRRGRGPVSYTHLDVYKRQQQSRQKPVWVPVKEHWSTGLRL